MPERPPPITSAYYVMGEVPAILPDLRPPQAPPTLLEKLLERRPIIQDRMGGILSSIKARIGFNEKHKWWQLNEDLIGLKKFLPGGGIVTYDDKRRKEEKKGHKEAASVGTGAIGDNHFVFYATHWDYFNGSVGVVVGEKHQTASDMAIKENLPWVNVYSSAGVRQQENYSALLQMPRMVNAIDTFRGKSDKPHIAVLLGSVWGGVSASVVPLADIKIAFAGTDYGFTGPKVIETYEGKPVPIGAQSAEAHALYRNLDVIVKDEEEFMKFMNRFLRVTKAAGTRLPSTITATLPPIEGQGLLSYTFGENGFSPLFPYETPLAQTSEEMQVFPVPMDKHSDPLYAQYQELAKSAGRPDTEFLMHNVFTDVVPLYNSYTIDNVKHYPAIIASIGKIGPTPFLIIGDQPSYQRTTDGVKKIPASPEPKDFKYMRRMMEMGERLGLPLVLLTDTLGAKPTLESERLGQSDEISLTILAGTRYKQPIISFITGALGSGGGIATQPIGENVSMGENTLAFVAEPASATSIMYSEAHPSIAKIIATLGGMRATAKDQQDLQIIPRDGTHDPQIIPESDNPNKSAEYMRDAIAHIYIKAQDTSEKRRMIRRKKTIRGIEGLKVKKRR